MADTVAEVRAEFRRLDDIDIGPHARRILARALALMARLEVENAISTAQHVHPEPTGETR